MKKNKAVFLDRDGVLIKDNHLITSLTQVEKIPEVDEFVRKIRKNDYLIIIVTNQPVVSRGMISYEEVVELNQKILKKVLNDSEKIIDDIFICPHHPDANVEKYRLNCNCRKPESGMLFEAAKKHNIDLKKSFMIGDRISDIVAGKGAGCCAILFKTGKHQEKMICTDLEIDSSWAIPDYDSDKIEEIFDFIKSIK